MSLPVLKPAISTTVVGPEPSQCTCSRAPCTATSSSTSVVGRTTVVGETVVVVVVVVVVGVIVVGAAVVVVLDESRAVVRCAMVVGETVVVVVSWAVLLASPLLEPPQPAIVIVTLRAATMAAMTVLVFMSACLSGEGCAGADGVDDVADRLRGLGGGCPLLGQHCVRGVRQRAMNAVG